MKKDDEEQVLVNRMRNIPCECWKCDLKQECVYHDRFQMYPKDEGGLGKCALLPENSGILQY